MSEKRFKYGRAFPINSDESLPCITDNKKGKNYFKMSDIVNVLNRQQATISKLEEENEQLKQKLENLDLNDKNDTIKMIDGKVFIKM